jgi:2-polyprenyl-6-hydroxyphenyl methylase / 3-demethylubiquinone-9 3-methyltransferase
MIKTYKDHFGGDYVKKYDKQGYSRLRRLLPLINFDQKDVVCDYACGNGMLVDLIHSKVALYYGIDFSEDFIDAASQRAKQKNYSNCKFICTEIMDYCKTNTCKFTKAFAFDFTGYLSDSEFMDVFGAILSSLKNDGYLYIHIADGDYFIEKIKKIRIFRLLFGVHVPLKNHMTASDYRKALIQIGYRNLNVHYLPHYNVLKYFHCLTYIPKIGKYFNARLFISCEK